MRVGGRLRHPLLRSDNSSIAFGTFCRAGHRVLPQKDFPRGHAINPELGAAAVLDPAQKKSHQAMYPSLRHVHAMAGNNIGAVDGGFTSISHHTCEAVSREFITQSRCSWGHCRGKDTRRPRSSWSSSSACVPRQCTWTSHQVTPPRLSSLHSADSCPGDAEIFSDCGTNFVEADAKACYTEGQAIAREMADNRMQWRFNPPFGASLRWPVGSGNEIH